MNEVAVVKACGTLPFRECHKLFGVSYREWRHAKDIGEIPVFGRGRPVDTDLTETILTLVREHPEYSQVRLAHELGCSEGKVNKVLKQHKLNLLWQRLRFAEVELKEMDPNLVNARKNPIQADGPGALVHIDAKRYGALKGGLLIVGMTVVDNFSGFSVLYLCPDGRKTGENAVAALDLFRSRFPGKMTKLYSDNGTEFVNSKVKAWCASNGVTHKTTKVGNPWSNGKAERTQAMFKREVVLPCLLEREYPAIPDLQEAINRKMEWWNDKRPHFGRVNQGLTPSTVASECAGLDEAEREEKLKELRQKVRHKNRKEWEKGS